MDDPGTNPAPTIPDGMLCPECRYTLSGLRAPRCPECAHEVTREDVEAHERVLRRLARLPGAWTRHAIFWSVVVVTYAMAAALIAGASYAVFAVALALLSSGVGVTIGLGWALGAIAPKGQRFRVATVWLVGLPYLHAPWLLVAACAAILIPVAFTDDSNHNTTAPVALLLCAMWMLSSVILGLIWLIRWSHDCRTLCRESGMAFGAGLFFGISIFIVSGFIGFLAGVSVATRAMGMEPLARGFWPL
ncbi:MAG: hypothetical protein AAFX05_15230 [Planctomycetota bacterium]